MQIKTTLFLIFISLTLFIGCGDKESIDENMISNSKTTSQKPSEFNLKTSDGKELKVKITQDGLQFEGLENKVVLLNFFGTWCPPCKAEIPHLLNIRKKLKKDFEILSVDIGKRGGGANTPKELAAFIEEFKITYPITTAGDNQQLFSAVSELNPSRTIPFVILFNKKGQYVQHYIGMKPEEMLFSDISKAIQMK